jgi:uncharacterized membrane protein YqjE
MTPSNGTPDAEKSLGEIVSEVSEKASLLVREEIELAKAEVQTKIRTLTKGAAVGAAAGVFLIFAVIMLLHTLAWLINDALGTNSVWPGFGIVTLFFIILGAIAGYMAYRAFKTGPPTPDQAIEQARITREAFDDMKGQSGEVKRSLETGSEAKS